MQHYRCSIQDTSESGNKLSPYSHISYLVASFITAGLDLQGNTKLLPPPGKIGEEISGRRHCLVCLQIQPNRQLTARLTYGTVCILFSMHKWPRNCVPAVVESAASETLGRSA